MVLRLISFSLNPCFNGRYSQRIRKDFVSFGGLRLNPCFNGRYSQRGGYNRVLCA